MQVNHFGLSCYCKETMENKIITCVLTLFIGLALQNKNKGMNATLDIENSSMKIEPDFVAFGHFKIDARNRPM